MLAAAARGESDAAAHASHCVACWRPDWLPRACVCARGAASRDRSTAGPGPRPGPDILYAPAGRRARSSPTPGCGGRRRSWSPAPSAYRGGEYLYQDFLYDDHGAHGRRRTRPIRAPPATPSRSRTGPTPTRPIPPTRTTPPTSSSCASKPLASATAFRVTLNTLKDPSLVAFSIAIGGTPGRDAPVPRRRERERARRPVPDRAPGAAPAWPPTCVDAATGAPVGGSAPTVDASTPPAARSRSASRTRPGTRPARSCASRPASACGTRREQPLPAAAADPPTPPTPAAPARPPTRPPSSTSPSASTSRCPQVGDPAGTAQSPAWWRDQRPGRRARARATSAPSTPTSTSASSRRRPTTTSGVPQSGPIDRILASHFETAAGRRLLRVLLPRRHQRLHRAPTRAACSRTRSTCRASRCRAQGYGMTLLLHSLGATYNQYLGSRNQSQFGERGPGSIVITPLGARPGRRLRQPRRGRRVRGVGGRRAPLQARSRVDRDHRLLDGRLRDVQARGAVPRPVRARPADRRRERGHEHDRLAAQHPGADVERGRRRAGAARPHTCRPRTELDRLGYRYELDIFTGRAPDARDPRPVRARGRVPRHGEGGPQPGARHLRRRPEPRPRRASASSPTTRTGSRARARAAPGQGTRRRVLARASAPATRSPPPRSSAPARSAAATSARSRSRASSRRGDRRRRSRPPNRIDLTAQNVSAVTINPKRAGVSCNVDLRVTSDGPLTVNLAGCKRWVLRSGDRKVLKIG